MIEIRLHVNHMSVQGVDWKALLAALNPEPQRELLYPLTMDPCFFKGKRPRAIIFPDGTRVETVSWKKLSETLLKTCAEDPEKRKSLRKLRNQIRGRTRTILGSSPAGMFSPVRLGQQLYFETNYSAEYLVKITTKRILDAVDFDYSGIWVALESA
ncbi:MAG: hypothetical protein HFG00_03580 [Oscillibacter sp.]|nr:hypothetical protein [Oscillibacter sp.]